MKEQARQVRRARNDIVPLLRELSEGGDVDIKRRAREALEALEAEAPRYPDRRWYAAWHRDRPEAVLRAKTAEGLIEWRSRTWRRFPSSPEIEDVTEEMGALLAGFAVPTDGKSLPPPPPLAGCTRLVLTVQEAAPATLALRPVWEPPSPGSFSVLGFGAMLQEMLDGSPPPEAFGH